MATVNKLNMYFKDAGDEKFSISLNKYVDSQVEDATVKALCDGIVTNKTVFRRAPQSVISAELVTTSTTQLDVTDD